MAVRAAEDAVVAQSLSSSRAATHWLFSHIAGVRGVWIPDSALLDDEGVLVAWLSTQPLRKKKKTTTAKPKARETRPDADVEIRHCDLMKLSLLRFEAHLQDLAKRFSTSESIAVLYTEAAALQLDETALDATIRSLCARERSMTAAEPDLSVPRSYPGGCFVLQAAVGSSQKHTTVTEHPGQEADTAEVTRIITRVNARSGSFSHEVRVPPQKKSREEDEGEDEEATRNEKEREACMPHIETQCRALLAQLESTNRLRIDALTLEFACVGRNRVVLTCAHNVKWIGPQTDHTQHQPLSRAEASMKRRATETTRTRPRYTHHFHVCRECRAPVEVDLARELLQSQTLLRGTLAKYQEMSERHADAESRCRHAVNQTLHQHTQIRGLETEVARLRVELAQQQTKTKEETQHKISVETQLVHSIEQTQKAQQDIAVAHERIQELLQLQREQLQSVESKAASKTQELETQELAHARQMHQMRQEIKELQAKNRKLQALYEAAQASSDEMKFQWGFVTRKLTDVGDCGVLPPKRVAGGFSSYPTPTLQNVEQVVKWIVDYETKRTVLEAQQHKSLHEKTIRKRLRMKVELMRLLATSPQKSASLTRRRSSCSPRKRPSVTPKKEPPVDQRPSVRWAQEQPTLVERRRSAMAKPKQGVTDTEATRAGMQ